MFTPFNRLDANPYFFSYSNLFFPFTHSQGPSTPKTSIGNTASI